MNVESAKVDDQVVQDWFTKLQDLIKDYPEDSYNAVETGLFYKCLPSKTFNIAVQKYFNGEKSKKRDSRSRKESS